MPSIRVSVIMLTFNRPEFIGRAIQSVVDQTLTDWELIVVHDGPDQQVMRVLREWEAREPRVRYFNRPTPGNIAEATNFALRNAHGQYIAILDDDDYWPDPEKLAKQVKFLDENPEYSGCGGGVIVIDHEGGETLRYCKPQHDAEIRRKALLANPLAHSSSMYRRRAAEQCGGYDESLPGFQDWDIWLKMGSVGKLYNFPEYFLCYQIWEGGGSFQQPVRNTRAALKIVRRHRHRYGLFPLGYAMAWMYHLYAHLPVPIKRASFGFLSRMKKRSFSERTAVAR